MLSRKTIAALFVVAISPMLACRGVLAQSTTTSGSGSVSQGSSGQQWSGIANVTSSSSSASISLGGTDANSVYSSSPSSYSGLTANSTTTSAGTASTLFSFPSAAVSGSINLSFQTSASFSGGGSGGTVAVEYSVSGGSWQSAYGTTSTTSGYVSSSVPIAGVTNLSNLRVQLYVVAAPGGPGSPTETAVGSVQSIQASFSSNGQVYPTASSVLTVSSLGLSLPSGPATTFNSLVATIQGTDVGAQATLQAQFTVGGSNIGSAQSLPMYGGSQNSYTLTGLNGLSLSSAQAASLGITLSVSVPASTSTVTQVGLSGFKVVINYTTAATATVKITGSEQMVSSAGAWDAGVVSVSLNGYSKSAIYGQGSTPASIASMIAAYFSEYCDSPAGAVASTTGSNAGLITFYLRKGATVTQLSASEQSIYSQSNFFGATYVPDNNAPAGTPVITDMSPSQGIAGTTVTLTGSNFGASGTALFNGTYITPSLWTSTSIVFNIPSGAKSGAITLSTATGDTSSGIFTVLSENGQTTADVYGYALTYAPNGNILKDADEVNGTWTYGYDSLNRLYAAVPGSGAGSGYAGHSLCMYYDSFGNRKYSALQTASCPAPAGTLPTSNATYNANNQLTSGSYLYDAEGNVLYDGVNWYAYDNDGRLCATQTNPVTGGTVAFAYLYDAEGRRVAKGTIAASAVSASSPLKSSACNPSVAANNFTVTESYVLGQSGEQLTALAPGTSWTRTNVYGAGLPLATYDNDAQGAVALHFLLTDHLGSRRLQTDPAGTPETDCQSLPYGDALNCVPAPNAPATADDANPLHYTGKERDTESGLDYFGARYFASSMGRFMSPDWSDYFDPVPYANLGNPQTLNLYAYVQNNPLSHRDFTGHDCDPDTVSTRADGATVVTAGACNYDFALWATAVGHHFIPQKMFQKWDPSSYAYKVANKATTGPLSDKTANYNDTLQRLNNKAVEDIVEKYLTTTGKDVKDLTAADLKAIGDEIKAAGGSIADFNSRLESTNPGVRTVEDAIEHAVQVVGESPFGQFVEETVDECVSGACVIP